MAVRFTPKMYIEHYATQRGITVAEIGVAPIVVISWAPSVIHAFAERTQAQPTTHWPWAKRYPFYTGQVQGQAVSFAQVGIGAPATVAAMEEMIACGARLFLGLGWAGSLQPSAPIGSFLIPTRCIREEGTSVHYVADEAALLPNEQLVERLQAAAQAEAENMVLGPHWTTDAPYREHNHTIAAYRQQGVVGVDMETSAMYALGQFRNVPVCNLLVISDDVWREWHSASWTPALKTATASAQDVIMRVLERDDLLPQSSLDFWDNSFDDEDWNGF